MLNLSEKSEKAFKAALADRLKRYVKTIAQDQYITGYNVLSDIMMHSPQWSGNFAKNWFMVLEGEELTYEELEEKYELGFRPDEPFDDASDYNRIRKMGQLTEAEIKDQVVGFNQSHLYRFLPKTDGLVGFTTKKVIIYNSTPYRENIESDTDDDGRSPYIRNINKVSGKVYTFKDTLARLQMLKRIRWGVTGNDGGSY